MTASSRKRLASGAFLAMFIYVPRTGEDPPTQGMMTYKERKGSYYARISSLVFHINRDKLLKVFGRVRLAF